MKDSTPTTPTTTTSPTSPTTNKEKTATNTVFRDTRAELAQFLKKKEEIEVGVDKFRKSSFEIDLSSF